MDVPFHTILVFIIFGAYFTAETVLAFKGFIIHTAVARYRNQIDFKARICLISSARLCQINAYLGFRPVFYVFAKVIDIGSCDVIIFDIAVFIANTYALGIADGICHFVVRQPERSVGVGDVQRVIDGVIIWYRYLGNGGITEGR